MSADLTEQEAEEFRRMYGEENEAPVFTPPPSTRRRPNRRCSVTETIIRQQQNYERATRSQWSDPSQAPESWATPSYSSEGCEGKDSTDPTNEENSLFSHINYNNSWDPNNSGNNMDIQSLHTGRTGRNRYPRAGGVSSKLAPNEFPDPWAPRATTSVPEDFPDPWTPRAA